MKREIIIHYKQKIIPILRKHQIKKAALFGSIVHDKLSKKSDIDILVEIKENADLFEFIALKLELEEVLKRKVDLVEYSTIKPDLKKSILNKQLPIYST